MKTNYMVALQVGGTMEQPYYTYRNIQNVEATSKADAESKYNSLNNCTYYYGKVIGKNGKRKVSDDAPTSNSF